MLIPCRAVQYSLMPASSASPESIAFDQAAPGAAGTRPLLAVVLIYCSTVAISVAAAAALVSGVPAEVLLASF